jgi:hypothetical protein
MQDKGYKDKIAKFRKESTTSLVGKVGPEQQFPFTNVKLHMLNQTNSELKDLSFYNRNAKNSGKFTGINNNKESATPITMFPGYDNSFNVNAVFSWKTSGFADMKCSVIRPGDLMLQIPGFSYDQKLYNVSGQTSVDSGSSISCSYVMDYIYLKDFPNHVSSVWSETLYFSRHL